jgi:hypothetical protein
MPNSAWLRFDVNDYARSREQARRHPNPLMIASLFFQLLALAAGGEIWFALALLPVEIVLFVALSWAFAFKHKRRRRRLREANQPESWPVTVPAWACPGVLNKHPRLGPRVGFLGYVTVDTNKVSFTPARYYARSYGIEAQTWNRDEWTPSVEPSFGLFGQKHLSLDSPNPHMVYVGGSVGAIETRHIDIWLRYARDFTV